MSIDRWMDKEDVVHIYSGMLLGHKKEWNNTICNNMDGPRDYHTKWSKSEKGKYHIVPLISSVQSLSSVQLFAATWTAAHQASCPSPTPGACSNSCPSSQWCHPTILSSVAPSPPASNLSQHQGLFQWVSSSLQVAKSCSFSFSFSPSNEYSGLISFRTDWFDLLAV